jgi:putative ABC transport system permease protein
VKDAGQDIVKLKNDPTLQGINGSLTLGFVITLTVSMVGFFIYWIISLRGRILQFGVLRAIGLPRGGVIRMVVLWEQLLISFTAIAAGIAVGVTASRLFVPLLGLAMHTEVQVIPFRLVSSGADFVRVIVVVGVTMTFALVALGAIVSRIKIAQAIKLGEE